MKKIILHLGAHRCGSTAIQTMLSRQRAALLNNGVSVCLREDMMRGEYDLRRLHRYKSLNPFSAMKLRQLAAQIDKQPNDTLVMSDENIMGTMPGVLDNRFYPFFPLLVNGMVKLQNQLGNDYSLCPRLLVRRQDQYIESVYAFRVPRGLTLDFDEFLARIDRKSLSWLRVATLLQQTSAILSPRVDVLEGWPKETAAQNAADFLSLPALGGAMPRRLSGNIRRSKGELRLILALNRAAISLDHAEKSGVLNDQSGSDAQMDIVQAMRLLKSSVTAHQLATLEQAFSAEAKLGFSEDERRTFLALYAQENQQLLKMDIVHADPSVWH